MTIKKFWIINAFLLIGFVIIQCTFLLKNSLILGMNPLTFILNILYNLIGFLILGIIIGMLSALIPYKQISYRLKIKTIVPILIFIIMLIYYSIFCYVYFQSKSNGVGFYPVINYEDIKAPAKIDCASIHNGSFEDDEYIIERFGEIQIQTSKLSGEKSEFKVSWINDCEYSLTPLSDSLQIIKVKIISVSADNYECYVNAPRKRKEAFYAKEKRIK
jgi:hypothetical protein